MAEPSILEIAQPFLEEAVKSKPPEERQFIIDYVQKELAKVRRKSQTIL